MCKVRCWRWLFGNKMPISSGRTLFKAHRLFISLNSRLESNKEEDEEKVEGAPCKDDARWVDPRLVRDGSLGEFLN